MVFSTRVAFVFYIAIVYCLNCYLKYKLCLTIVPQRRHLRGGIYDENVVEVRVKNIKMI